jgi:signal transduction histidine kinase
VWFGITIFCAVAFSGVIMWLAGDGHHHTSPRLLALLGGAMVLWGMSGMISWRLTRPLAALVQVTRDIGAGRLDARMDVERMGADDLAVIGEAVNDMAERIAKQLEDQRELLAAVSHEIRTPLGHLRVLLDLARESGLSDGTAHELEREVLLIDALVDQLLASSRLDFGTIDRRSLDAVDLAIRGLERANLDPTLLHVETDARTIAGDAALIGQALANLLRNAEEHGGGVTTLRVADSREQLAFEVEDSGSGFAEGELGRAFESFRRGEGTGRGSLGLGLSLVRRIAQAHGGDAQAWNVPGGGAKVRFTVSRLREGVRPLR